MDFITQNIEFILAIISFIVAVIAFFFTKEKKVPSLFIALMIVVCFLLSVQYFRTWDYVEVPNVTGIPYNEARDILRSNGLQEQPFKGNAVRFSPDDNEIVIRQVPDVYEQCKKNGDVKLYFSEGNVSEEIPHNTMELPLLTINIENVAFFNDGYYYEYANPQNTSESYIIDFDRGIAGTFSYSRELSAEERENWMHGGKIYDSNGHEVGYSGNYPTFWSSPDGKFAVQFPKDIQPGQYVYELYQDINGQQVSDKISFIIE